jgi:hypothetical protein
MDANWQTERCSCCRVGDAPSTDLLSPFLSHFIRFFDHPHLLSLAAIVAAWKWWNTSRSHPTSTPLHDTFYVMISVTFECDCPFLLQFYVAGDGPTTTNIKMNTKWLCKYVTRVVLTQPLNHCKKSFTCLSFCRLSLLGMGLQQPISKWILN